MASRIFVTAAKAATRSAANHKRMVIRTSARFLKVERAEDSNSKVCCRRFFGTYPEEDYDKWYSHGYCGNVTACEDTRLDFMNADDIYDVSEIHGYSFKEEGDAKSDEYNPFSTFAERYDITDDYVELEDDYLVLHDRDVVTTYGYDSSDDGSLEY